MNNRDLRVPAIALAMACGLLSSVCRALTGNELLDDCREKSDLKAGICLGFVQGYTVGYDAGRRGGAMFERFGDINYQLLKDKGPEISAVSDRAAYYCVPSRVTNQQVIDVVLKYLEAHPETRHFEAGSIVASAIHEAFPC